jgi:hypothetical protein
VLEMLSRTTLVGLYHVNTPFQEGIKPLPRMILIYLPVLFDKGFQFSEELFDCV